jgi:hypothetical protein
MVMERKAARKIPVYAKSNDPDVSLNSRIPAVARRAAPPALSSLPIMFVLMAVSSLTALLFVYIFMPSLWTSMMAVDDSLDHHESGVTLVASRMYRHSSMRTGK